MAFYLFGFSGVGVSFELPHLVFSAVLVEEEVGALFSCDDSKAIAVNYFETSKWLWLCLSSLIRVMKGPSRFAANIPPNGSH